MKNIKNLWKHKKKSKQHPRIIVLMYKYWIIILKCYVKKHTPQGEPFSYIYIYILYIYIYMVTHPPKIYFWLTFILTLNLILSSCSSGISVVHISSARSNLIQSWRIHNVQPEAGWVEAWRGSEEAVRKVVKVEKVVKEVKVVIFCWIYWFLQWILWILVWKSMKSQGQPKVLHWF